MKRAGIACKKMGRVKKELIRFYLCKETFVMRVALRVEFECSGHSSGLIIGLDVFA